MENKSTTWSEIPNEGKDITKQKLASEERKKFKRAGLRESQSTIQVGKLTMWVRSFEKEKFLESSRKRSKTMNEVINRWSNFCNPHWELICRNKWHQGPQKYSHNRKWLYGHTSMLDIALKVLRHFYLLMKPLGRYFQVWFPYYQAAEFILEMTRQVWKS